MPGTVLCGHNTDSWGLSSPRTHLHTHTHTCLPSHTRTQLSHSHTRALTHTYTPHTHAPTCTHAHTSSHWFTYMLLPAMLSPLTNLTRARTQDFLKHSCGNCFQRLGEGVSQSEARLLENASSVLEGLLTNVFCATERKGSQRKGAKCRAGPRRRTRCAWPESHLFREKVGSAEQMGVFSVSLIAV